jgi:phosphatidylethanolamine-binding protein (PEBP) family uncharacterized protein
MKRWIFMFKPLALFFLIIYANAQARGETDYGGPYPPIGRHRYFHKLYVLDTVLPDLKQPTTAKFEEAMEGHVILRAELIGLYQRK